MEAAGGLSTKPIRAGSHADVLQVHRIPESHAWKQLFHTLLEGEDLNLEVETGVIEARERFLEIHSAYEAPTKEKEKENKETETF